MEKFIFSLHAINVLKERKIKEELVLETIKNPDWENFGKDNNIHYFKVIPEHGNKVLHVIVNPHQLPKKIITAYFDRKARKIYENKNR